MPVPDQPRIGQECSDLILSGQCVAFVGSGLSASQFDSWPKLVNRLCDRCGASTRVSDDETDAEKLIQAAEDAKISSGSAYLTCLGEHFGRIPDINPCYDLLLKLPFKSIVTLNFDPVLAYKAGLQQVADVSFRILPYPGLDRAEMRRGAIFYAHGLIQVGKPVCDGSIVLAKSEYDHAYENGGPLQRFMSELLQRDPICFVGCGLRDPPLKGLFDRARRDQVESARLLGYGRPRRFALVADPTSTTAIPQPGSSDHDRGADDLRRHRELTEQFYSDRDIDVEFYDPMDRHHTGLRLMLEKLTVVTPLPIQENPYRNDSTIL